MPGFVAIIPARYASTRFPGKPLAVLGGKTIIERVVAQASKVFDQVYVATDDRRIFDAVEAAGARAVMTSEHHRSGTDRCREAYERSGSRADVVVNIQGDEPFIHPEQLRQLCACFDDPRVEIATLARPFDPARGYDALENPNSPKVVVDSRGRALLFSRSVVPYIRGHERREWPSLFPYLTHIGLYGYRADTLKRITELPPSPLEVAESLEQLRWLENGYYIRVALSDYPTVGIDTPQDLEQAKQYLKRLESKEQRLESRD